MRRQLLCCTCEFNRGKFRWNCSNLPVYFHQWQQYHINSFFQTDGEARLLLMNDGLCWLHPGMRIWSSGLEAGPSELSPWDLTSGLHGSLLNFRLHIPTISELLAFAVFTPCRWVYLKRSWCRGFLLHFRPRSWGLTLAWCAHHYL